ncbi:unnamed protein product [Candidula unifasciata]|uniref:SCP domain-containing protein n=1 Tax=Candidula unifasciata TaxID=100452 RepID=A0A8S3Z615_9EUPU|nr:unnamed protein product [Candidula unifasciata]
MKTSRVHLQALYVISFAVHVVLVCGQERSDSDYNQLEAARFLTLSNEVRRQAGKPPMDWNELLASKAQILLDTCRWSSGFITPGTVMYQGQSNSPDDRGPERVMQTIMRETPRTIGAHREICCRGLHRPCCRYEKMMSTEFTSVGCAQRMCNFTVTRITFPNVYMFACFYTSSEDEDQ